MSTGILVVDNYSPRTATGFVHGVQSLPSLVVLHGWLLPFVGDLFFTHFFAFPFLFSVRLSYSML